jgi:hypothetical protein
VYTNLRHCHKSPNHHRTSENHSIAMIVTSFDSQPSVLPIPRHLSNPLDRVAKRFRTQAIFDVRMTTDRVTIVSSLVIGSIVYVGAGEMRDPGKGCARQNFD